jgi:hypothetical protein
MEFQYYCYYCYNIFIDLYNILFGLYIITKNLFYLLIRNKNIFLLIIILNESNIYLYL